MSNAAKKSSPTEESSTIQRLANELTITGASENNLKNLSLSIPHDQCTVITGLSGSGKSSLAFDTVYAEGQRRYIETFSPYTRQFFDKVKKPNVESITNVRPAIAIQQKTKITSARSTVGSLTNSNDYLKIIWGALSSPHCPTCGDPLVRWNAGTIADSITNTLENRDQTILVGAIIKSDPSYIDLELDRLKTLGFSRIWDEKTKSIIALAEIDGSKLPSQEKIFVVVDRIKRGSTIKRIKNSIEQGFSLNSTEVAIVYNYDDEKLTPSVKIFSKNFVCPKDGFTAKPPKGYLFSFNHPLGACSTCKGFGYELSISKAKVIPDVSKTLRDNAIACWSGPSSEWERKNLFAFCEKHKISLDTPWKDLSEATKNLLFTTKEKNYWGIDHWFTWLETKIYKMHVRVFLSRYREQVICKTCAGTRLKPDALSYKVHGKHIGEIWTVPLGDLLQWIESVQSEAQKNQDIYRPLKEPFANLLGRLRYLVSLGLSYLTLDRQAKTLSGGETQRVNLASALGSELVSTQFVLDEPSVGLHPRDSDRLTESIKALTRKGNSLLVVEHDPDVIAEADHIIEIGPKAGANGGQVVFNDSSSKWPGVAIQQALHQPLACKNAEFLKITGATSRNIKNIDVSIPLQRLVCLTGVSGSGKSTFAHEILKNAWEVFQGEKEADDSFKKTSGFEKITELVYVDQSPLAKSPRANIATYTKMWEVIRNLLANTEAAVAKGFSKSTFSFNVNAGRCTACEGAGFIREDMQFLSDVYVPCESCLGKRFQPTVLDVTYKDKSVDDFLSMTVDEAVDFFADEKGIRENVYILQQLGLGACRLGHPLSELSGGEAQRLKLVPYLTGISQQNVLFAFDEPTTGLHVHDAERLIELLRNLVTRGNTVLCIEHNLSVIQNADWIIDLGPEGGAAGGKLLFAGPIDEFLKNTTSETATYLKKYIQDIQANPIKGANKKKKNNITNISQRAKDLLITGATEHNLKNITVSVPTDRIVAITGVSGSGKSTLAKDIIYAEGQRRYLDCLSPYARQFIKELKRPDIESIVNVRPTICVYQHTFQPSALSTVATMSEVYNFLRLLYAKTGTQYCPDHPEKMIAPLSPEEMADNIMRRKDSAVRMLSPVINQKKGNHRAVFDRALESEIFEVRVDGLMGKPADFIDALAKTKVHSIDYVIGKFNPKTINRSALIDTIKTALTLGGGTITILGADNREEVLSSERTCPVCQTGFFKIDPEDLSFNSKRGRCTKCDGVGKLDSGDTCPECDGARIQKIGRNVRINRKNIFEATSLNASDLLEFLDQIHISKAHAALSEPIIIELRSKLEALSALGLSYISLARSCQSLSGGELQRLRLSAAMGSPLSGVMYIFDEPSAGLHPHDNRLVLKKLRGLCDRGNAVLMIEHDVESIKSSDHIIDIGPLAGTHGGEVVFNGALKDYPLSNDSPTAIALKKPVAFSSTADKAESFLHIHAKNCHNIKDLKAKIPLHQLVVVGGVSGAGKSSLIHSVVIDTILNGKEKKNELTSATGSLKLDTAVDKVIFIDQKPIGSTSRSTPASYLGIWDEIRKVFASTLEAKTQGWSNSFFSYNSGNGRCPECKGAGTITLEMNFLADAKIICEACDGTRYTDDALTVRYMGRNVSDVLNLTFDEAKEIFTNHRKIHHIIKTCCDLGLGYLKLGQSSATLSGGEAQRLKIVSELSSAMRGHTLYVLDEPTLGLHRFDVLRLLDALRALVNRGASVFVIEHDIDTIAAADYFIEMGPGPGEAGGNIIAEGTPKNFLKKKTPWGQMLREQLD